MNPATPITPAASNIRSQQWVVFLMILLDSFQTISCVFADARESHYGCLKKT